MQTKKHLPKLSESAEITRKVQRKKERKMKHNLSKNNIKFKQKGKGVNVDVDIRFNRFDNQFHKAQLKLTETILHDMKPYMPNPNLARMVDDSTIIAAKGPQGRFLYEGIKMVGVNTGSAYAKQGEKKVPVCERFKQNIKYKNPKARPHWFEVAKKIHCKDWIKKVKQIVGGK